MKHPATRSVIRLAWFAALIMIVSNGSPAGAASITGAATTPAQEGSCHPDYTPCLPHYSGDALNCKHLSAEQKPVNLVDLDVDPYRLDPDGDGVACDDEESSSTTTTTAAAAATTTSLTPTVTTRVQSTQQLPVTGSGNVLLIALIGFLLLDLGYMAATTARPRRRRPSAS